MSIELTDLPNYSHGRYLQTRDDSLVWSDPKDIIKFVCTNRTTPIVATNNIWSEIVPYTFKLQEVVAYLTQPASSGSFVIRIRKNGSSIFSTNLTLDPGEKTSITAATSAVLSSTDIAKGDEFTVDVLDAADGTASGLVIYFIGYHTTDVGADTQPPSKPTLTLDNVTYTSVRINRSTSTDNVGVTSYQIRVNGGEYVSEVMNIGLTNPYVLQNLDPNTQYTIELRAVDGATNISPWSDSQSTTTLAPPLALDAITTPVWSAHSVKKLRSAYAGNCLRVKDQLNNETDVPFDSNGLIDVSGLNGANTYKVITWYDQSGNNRHLTGIATGHEPQLSISSKSIRYQPESSDRFLAHTLGNLSSLTAGEVFIKRKLDTNSITEGLGGNGLAWILGNGNSTSYYGQYPSASQNTHFHDDFGSSTRKSYPHGTDLTQYHVYSAYSMANDWAAYINGVLKYSTTTNTVSFPNPGILGRVVSGAGMVGNMETYILLTTKTSSTEREFLHANL